MTIVVTDAKGFEVGHNTGVFQPAIHRVLIERNNVYGAENLVSNFRDAKLNFNEQEWIMFIQLINTLPVGEYGDLSWQRE